jgi:hypothetical protein
MLTNLVYSDPMRNPMGPPPLLLTHNRNYRLPAQATLCRAAQRECALEHAPVRTRSPADHLRRLALNRDRQPCELIQLGRGQGQTQGFKALSPGPGR